MQYSCRDLDKIVESDFNVQFNEDAFLSHIESCRDCRARLELTPELEEQLRGLMPTPAPVSFSQRVMQGISAAERRQKKLAAIATFQVVAAAILLMFSSVILFLNRGVVFAVAQSLDVGAWFSQTFDSAKSFGPVVGKFLADLLKVFQSPLLATAIVATTVLVFVFSVMKLKEAAE